MTAGSPRFEVRVRVGLGRAGVVLACLTTTGPAIGQSAPSPPSPTSPPSSSPAPTPAQLAEAKKFFDAGLKLMKEQLYQEALASFIEAYRISPRESIQNNIALMRRNLKDLAGAASAYEELLARFGDKMKPAAKAEAQHALDELYMLTGVATIRVQDADAEVTIDGKSIGKTPIAKPIRLNIGPHVVTITKPGFETLTKEIVIKGHDDIPVDGPLQTEIFTGHVRATIMTATPDPTAKIFVDGNAAPGASGGAWEGDLAPGLHTFEAKGETTYTQPKQIEVARRGTYAVLLDLVAATSTVSITTGSADASILVDGKTVGRGAWEGTVATGRHELTVTRAGFVTYSTALVVRLGERLNENVRLQPDPKLAVPEHTWKGVYAQLNFAALFGAGTPSNEIARGVDLAAPVKASSSVGGGLNVRVGYSFGYIGAEGFILGAYDHSTASIAYATGQATATHPGNDSRTEDYEFHRFGGGFGAGARFMPKMQTVRPTFGLGTGLALKAGTYHREATSAGGNNAYSSDLVTFLAPMLIMDGGIELGTTPGTRFYLGIMLVLEFPAGAPAAASPSSTIPPPSPRSLDVANGTDVFVGPSLGMQFGE